MSRLIIGLSVLVFTGMTVGGCQSTGLVLAEGATPLSRSDLYGYLSDHRGEWYLLLSGRLL